MLFYNIRKVKLTISESAYLVICECVIFWEKARIPTKYFSNSVKKNINKMIIGRIISRRKSSVSCSEFLIPLFFNPLLKRYKVLRYHEAIFF